MNPDEVRNMSTEEAEAYIAAAQDRATLPRRRAEEVIAQATPTHSLRCTATGQHGQHVWVDGETPWWCIGTDSVEAVNSRKEHTLDGVPIKHGMTAFDYNLRECQVIGVQSMNHGTVWYETTTGMFDASRLWARKPRSF